MEVKHESDLELKDLDEFHGSEHYYPIMCGIHVTDGVRYLMENGYSWMVTDAAVILRLQPTVRGQDFVVVRLKRLDEGRAKVVYDDGNGNLLFEQGYDWTDAKREPKLFFADGVFMLASEY